MDSSKGTADVQGASYVALYADDEHKTDINTSVCEHLASFLRISYDDKAVLLEGDQRKVYGDGVGHLWFMKDGFVADYVAAGQAHVSEQEVNKALHEAGVGRSVLRIKHKTHRTWKTTDTAFPHSDGHERRTVAGLPMPVPGGLPTATMQSPLGSLTAQVNEDWEIDDVERDRRTSTVTTTYVNVRTEETRIVVTNDEGRVFPDGDPPPVGAHFPDPKHSAKRQAWDCLNHEAQWLPYYYLKVFQKARDAGLSLERLWLVLEDLVEKIERRATYADGADLLDYKCLDATEFMAGPRWNDEEPDFSTARQLTERHAAPQLERGAYHTLAEIRAAVARGNPMYVAPALPPPLEN